MKVRRLLAAGLALALALFGPAAADPATDATLASALIDGASERIGEARDADESLAALIGAAVAFEAGLSALREGLRRQAARADDLRQEARARRDAATRAAGALASLSGASLPAMLASPLGPVGSARAAMMISGAAPALRRRAMAAEAALAEAEALRARTEKTRAALRAQLAAVQEARAEAAEGRRPDAPDISGASAALIRFAHDSAAAASAASAFSPGALPPPVSGRIKRRFSSALPGVEIEASAGALVLAPASGAVRFAGPVPGRGAAVMLEPAPGALIVLAGPFAPLAEAGGIVRAGDPLAHLGGARGATGEFLVEDRVTEGALSVVTLYVEIRLDGSPVDPADWFAFAE